MSPEELFAKYFAPLYPKGVSLAELRRTDANPAQNPSILAQIAGAAVAFAKLAPAAIGEATLLDFSDASVHKLGALLTKERRDRWMVESDGEAPLIVKIATHGALYLGACVVKNHGGAWQVRRPTWESLVRLESKAGVADLALFQWWLKALSDDEIGKARLADRYRTYVEVPTFDASKLEIIAPASRKVPRLAKVRYDTLHQHLRAHLPELKSVGDDFPSPERFAEMSFKQLDFLLVGEGRMLIAWGPTDRGAHVFFFDKSGFVKSAFYEADAFPAPVVEAKDDKLLVLVRVNGEERAHETMWWGP